LRLPICDNLAVRMKKQDTWSLSEGLSVVNNKHAKTSMII
jgi:hypothetical protein